MQYACVRTAHAHARIPVNPSPSPPIAGALHPPHPQHLATCTTKPASDQTRQLGESPRLTNETRDQACARPQTTDPRREISAVWESNPQDCQHSTQMIMEGEEHDCSHDVERDDDDRDR